MRAPKMMKIIVTVLLYNLLLQSNVDGEPMVKVQICSGIFANATNDALNRIEQSALKKGFGNFRVKVYGARGRGRYQTKEIPLTKVQFEGLGKSQMLSHNSSETRFEVRIEYGNKKVSQIGNKRIQNVYLFLNLEIIATLLFDVDKDELVFHVHECDIYLKNYETNVDEKIDLRPGKIKGKWVSRLCLVVNQIIDILNENWKDYLNIDPSGNESLVLKSSSFNPPNCLQLNLNLVSGNSEVISSQTHDVLEENGISLAEDYFNTMLSANIQLSELNTKLEEKNLLLQPDELMLLIQDVHETDPTILKITITKMPQLSLNSLNQTMTAMIKLEGFSSKSDKSIFEVTFETKVNVDLQLNNNQLILQFLSSGGQVIHSWTSSVGNSGDLDYDNLVIFIKKLHTETILPLFNDLHVTFPIPFWILGSKVVFKTGTVQIIP